LKLVSPKAFGVVRLRYRYDPERDALVELETGKRYVADPRTGFFVSREGERLLPGFPVFVGLRNYRELFTNPQVVGPFLRVFLWTTAFAVLTVLTTFALGLLLALGLHDRTLALRGLYRTLLILPWAVPAFISIMVWRGLLNPIGPVNRTLEALLGVEVPWLVDPFWAKVAVLLVNLWLGFPYMMTISLGALQSIPEELYEAARVDGAGPWQRFWTITLPLLLVAVGPLLVGSFAFNFNNFNLIFLLTGGGPPLPGAQTPAGATDLLISYTYKLAFSGGWGQQFGLAAAVSTVIFLIVGTISALNFKLTGALEEVSENV
jgi:ABC-type sugar transport system permease subunit